VSIPRSPSSAALAAGCILAARLQGGCSTTCTDVPAETRTFVLGRDAGPDAVGPRPIEECRILCGDTTPDDSAQPHVTACRLTIVDGGDSLVACDETPYRMCTPR
jgi:hypothetical protein